MKQEFLIRYNTNSTGDTDKWRIVTDEKEILVSEIQINVSSFTSKDEIPEVGTKYHIKCEGTLTIKDNKAEIN